MAGNVGNLSIVYGHWLCDVCRFLENNPFADVEPPKYEKKPPRVIGMEEEMAFLTWLARRVGKWRLPFLFLEVKALTGCRIGELARTPRANLKDGRLCFEAITTKGRKYRGKAASGDLRGTEEAIRPNLRIRAVCRSNASLLPEAGEDPPPKW